MPTDCSSPSVVLCVEWQIELDQDVNHYLPPGLQVDSVFSTPVNLARLLTHTSGFSDEESGPPPGTGVPSRAL